IEHYDGGPVGLDTIAAALSEPRDTIEDVYEPFLLQQGFLGRTPRGRIATRKAYEHLGRPPPRGAPATPEPQGSLFCGEIFGFASRWRAGYSRGVANRDSVLVVDDDAVSRHVLAQALNDVGFATTVASSGAEALACLAKRVPGIVLLDLVMPPPDGFSVLRSM